MATFAREAWGSRQPHHVSLGNALWVGASGASRGFRVHPLPFLGVPPGLGLVAGSLGLPQSVMGADRASPGQEAAGAHTPLSPLTGLPRFSRSGAPGCCRRRPDVR